jgi:hypothetical protein
MKKGYYWILSKTNSSCVESDFVHFKGVSNHDFFINWLLYDHPQYKLMLWYPDPKIMPLHEMIRECNCRDFSVESVFLQSFQNGKIFMIHFESKCNEMRHLDLEPKPPGLNQSASMLWSVHRCAVPIMKTCILFNCKTNWWPPALDTAVWGCSFMGQTLMPRIPTLHSYHNHEYDFTCINPVL